MTRAKTRPGRLAALDQILLQEERPLLTAPGAAAVVDVGLGAMPWTTVELADALAPLLPSEVVGVDVDPRVVSRAVRFARPGLSFRVGDLGAPGVSARLVRAMNVLRDVRPAEVPRAHAALTESLVDGGLAVEGSCGPHGEVGVVHRLRRRGDRVVREGLWLWTDGSRGSAPLLFRDRLPRDLRRSVAPGHPLGELFTAWTEAFGEVRGVAGLARLDASVAHLDRPDLRTLRPGVVSWTPDGGVPPGA